MNEYTGIYKGIPLETFSCSPECCILLRAEHGKYSQHEIVNILKHIKSQFPDTLILWLPADVSIETCTIQQLQQIRNALDDYIERLDNKND